MNEDEFGSGVSGNENGNSITKFSEIFSQSPFNPTSSVPEAAKALSFDKNHFCFDFFNIDFLAFFKLKGFFTPYVDVVGGLDTV